MCRFSAISDQDLLDRRRTEDFADGVSLESLSTSIEDTSPQEAIAGVTVKPAETNDRAPSAIEESAKGTTSGSLNKVLDLAVKSRSQKHPTAKISFCKEPPPFRKYRLKTSITRSIFFKHG
jgi:hypothetical protein